MNSDKPLILFIVFLLKSIKSSDITKNYFSIKLVDETMNQGTYIRPTQGNGYLYLVTGEDVFPKRRHIIKFNMDSATYDEHIIYSSQYGFWRGEPYYYYNDSDYLFISTFHDENTGISTIERYDFKLKDKSQEEFKLYGYRRAFKQAGKYFYHIFIDPNTYKYLFIVKLSINKFQVDQNLFLAVKVSNDTELLRYEAMISCDFTNDQVYLLCSYFTENYEVAVTVYDTDLNKIKTEIFPKITGYNDSFIKIAYLKNNNYFILLYCHDNIATLRYFSFENKQFVDKLSSIIKSANNYLDVEDTHNAPGNNRNDMTVVNSNKFVKIFCPYVSYSSPIIITIFEFHDNDSALSIKIYNMINLNNFNELDLPTITMLKNSFVICLSATRNQVHRPGYFMINFPNSINILLNGDTIEVKKLISIENKLFSIFVKFKVLSIPTDFEIINTLNFLKIKINDELDENAILKLRRYRVNGGEYILKYEAIARGYDSGFSQMKVYPPNTVLNNNELYFGGTQGTIAMNFKQCLEGYYSIETINNICTNEMPHGYYLDLTNKMYKKCQNECEECYGAPINTKNMNCKTCKSNYFKTEDTNSCYNSVIDNYYLDKNKNLLRRCHENCLQCNSAPLAFNKMNCLKCQPNFYMTADTNSCYDSVIDNYYLDNSTNMLRKCDRTCLQCNSAPLNTAYMNCLKCKPNFYLTEDTHSCYESIIDNYYLDNSTNMLRRCHENCLQCNSAPLNSSYMNCLKCKPKFYMTEDTNSCYNSAIDNYYLEPTFKVLLRCHEKCLRCSHIPDSSTYMNCLKCYPNFYLTEDTYSCYDHIIDNYYLDNRTNQLRRCYKRCQNCIWAQNNTSMNCLSCKNSSYFYKKDTLDCILPEEFMKSRFLDLKATDNYNFYVYCFIFIISVILIIVLLCCFLNKKNENQITTELKNMKKIIND